MARKLKTKVKRYRKSNGIVRKVYLLDLILAAVRSDMFLVDSGDALVISDATNQNRTVPVNRSVSPASVSAASETSGLAGRRLTIRSPMALATSSSPRTIRTRCTAVDPWAIGAEPDRSVSCPSEYHKNVYFFQPLIGRFSLLALNLKVFEVHSLVSQQHSNALPKHWVLFTGFTKKFHKKSSKNSRPIMTRTKSGRM